MKELEIREKEERKIILLGNCPFCDRKIKATSRDQLYWNLSLHLKQRHSDESEAKILLRQLEEQKKIKKGEIKK